MHKFITLFVLFFNVVTSTKNISFHSEKQHTIAESTMWTDVSEIKVRDENIGEIIMKYKSNWNDGKLKLFDLIAQFYEHTHQAIEYENNGFKIGKYVLFYYFFII